MWGKLILILDIVEFIYPILNDGAFTLYIVGIKNRFCIDGTF